MSSAEVSAERTAWCAFGAFALSAALHNYTNVIALGAQRGSGTRTP